MTTPDQQISATDDTVQRAAVPITANGSGGRGEAEGTGASSVSLEVAPAVDLSAPLSGVGRDTDGAPLPRDAAMEEDNGPDREEKASSVSDPAEKGDSEDGRAISSLRLPPSDPSDPDFDASAYNPAFSFEAALQTWIGHMKAPPHWNVWQKGIRQIAVHWCEYDNELCRLGEEEKAIQAYYAQLYHKTMQPVFGMQWRLLRSQTLVSRNIEAFEAAAAPPLQIRGSSRLPAPPLRGRPKERAITPRRGISTGAVIGSIPQPVVRPRLVGDLEGTRVSPIPVVTGGVGRVPPSRTALPGAMPAADPSRFEMSPTGGRGSEDPGLTPQGRAVHAPVVESVGMKYLVPAVIGAVAQHAPPVVSAPGVRESGASLSERKLQLSDSLKRLGTDSSVIGYALKVEESKANLHVWHNARRDGLTSLEFKPWCVSKFSQRFCLFSHSVEDQMSTSAALAYFACTSTTEQSDAIAYVLAHEDDGEEVHSYEDAPASDARGSFRTPAASRMGSGMQFPGDQPPGDGARDVRSEDIPRGDGVREGAGGNSFTRDTFNGLTAVVETLERVNHRVASNHAEVAEALKSLSQKKEDSGFDDKYNAIVEVSLTKRFRNSRIGTVTSIGSGISLVQFYTFNLWGGGNFDLSIGW